MLYPSGLPLTGVLLLPLAASGKAYGKRSIVSLTKGELEGQRPSRISRRGVWGEGGSPPPTNSRRGAVGGRAADLPPTRNMYILRQAVSKHEQTVSGKQIFII